MSSGETTVILDLREELRQGGKPLGQILAVARNLLAGQSLQLITPFEPLPLMSMLQRFGLKHRSRQLGVDHWETLFACELPEVNPDAAPVIREAGAGTGRVHAVDARGLEPPQPMVKILTELEKVHGQDRLEARTDRRPLHLLDALHERGFQSTSEEQPDGSWLTLIHH